MLPDRLIVIFPGLAHSKSEIHTASKPARGSLQDHDEEVITR
jgi:hypothetical protein